MTNKSNEPLDSQTALAYCSAWAKWDDDDLTKIRRLDDGEFYGSLGYPDFKYDPSTHTLSMWCILAAGDGSWNERPDVIAEFRKIEKTGELEGGVFEEIALPWFYDRDSVTLFMRWDFKTRDFSESEFVTVADRRSKLAYIWRRNKFGALVDALNPAWFSTHPRGLRKPPAADDNR